MNVEEVEQKHKDVQLVCNKALEVALFAVQLARQLAKELKAWADTLPDASKLESETEKLFSPELQAWLQEYLKVHSLDFAESITDTKPRIIQEAMKLLDIIPTIITQKES